MALDVGGKIVETDEEGYLENRDEWDMEIAKAIARRHTILALIFILTI